MTIMLIGDFYEDEDLQTGEPFSGSLGYILKSMLRQIGIEFRDCYRTCVIREVPKGRQDITSFCGPRTEGIPGLPGIIRGKYIRAEYANHLRRLYYEINTINPTIIVPLGGPATWTVLGVSGIKAVRGSTAASVDTIAKGVGSSLVRDYKVLPTYDPAAIRRDWSLRAVGLSDFNKVRHESTFPEVVRPAREIWLEPTLDDLERFEQEYFRDAPYLSTDIETKGGQMTCIGFAPSPDRAIVIPFWSARQADGNYWRSHEQEMAALRIVRRWCETYPTVFQNGMYDMHYLWKVYGIRTMNFHGDTMLLHHALQPEMPKALGFLATLYTNEASWKFMRTANETLKKED